MIDFSTMAISIFILGVIFGIIMEVYSVIKRNQNKELSDIIDEYQKRLSEEISAHQKMQYDRVKLFRRIIDASRDLDERIKFLESIELDGSPDPTENAEDLRENRNGLNHE